MILNNYVTRKPFQLNPIKNAKQAFHQSKKIVYNLSVSVQQKLIK